MEILVLANHKYINQLHAETGCSLEDLQEEAMYEWDGLQERIKLFPVRVQLDNDDNDDIYIYI